MVRVYQVLRAKSPVVLDPIQHVFIASCLLKFESLHQKLGILSLSTVLRGHGIDNLWQALKLFPIDNLGNSKVYIARTGADLLGAHG